MSINFYNKQIKDFTLQESASILGCLLMSVGMVCSRLLLSIGMILMLLVALHPADIKYNWQKFKQSKFAMAGVLFFLAYVLSGFWSADTTNWVKMVQIKLPFLFLPFALIGMPLQNVKWFKIMLAGLLCALLGGMLYGFYGIVKNPEIYALGVHIPSPMEGDYIRFTIVVVLTFIMIVYSLRSKSLLELNKWEILLLLAWGAIGLVYIFVQAAKSGIVALAIFLSMFVLEYCIRKRKFILLGVAVLIAVVSAFFISRVPSVSRQVDNFSHERQVMQHEDSIGLNSSSSFVPRINSYKIAEDVIRANLLLGVGAGDVKTEMDKLYIAEFPDLNPVARILPHNELLCSLLAIGVPLTLLTLVVMVFIPLLRKDNRTNIYFLTTWVVIFFGLSIEPMLEVQYGIFVFIFFMQLWVGIPKIDRSTNP